MPHLLVLGTSGAAKRIVKALDERGVKAERVSSPGEVERAVDEHTRAVFVVPPVENLSVADFAERFRAEHTWIPVYVALGGPIAERALRKLYEAGAQAVFEWPGDREPLLRTAFRIAGMLNPLQGTGVAADVALEELVNASLRTAPHDFGKRLVGRVKHRIAVLSGAVDALWKIKEAERVVSRVPGVEDVIAASVEVQAPKRSDRAIASAVRQILKHATSVDPSTLVVRVSSGRVVLSGAVDDRAELVRAVRLAHEVVGVLGVESSVSVSREARARDKAVAERVAKAIATHFPKVKVDVAVFAGVVVLTGWVASAAARVELQELAAGQRGVRRVVDKLRVRGPRRLS